MNNIEGQINIDIFPQRTNGASVEVTSSRPVQAAKVFIGKTPEDVLSIVPLLFSVCGTAQTRAALTCIEQHLHIEADPAVETARDMLVLLENAKEHLMRIFLDWPKLFDLKDDSKHLPYLCKLISEFKPALFQKGLAFTLDSKLDIDNKKLNRLIDTLEEYLHDHVFHCSTQNWLAHQDIKGLCEWAGQSRNIAAQSINVICKQGWASQGSINYQQLPELESRQLVKQLKADDADEFIARPVWQGSCYETTTLTRQFEHPLIQSLHQKFQATLITRWVARLVELARIPQQLHAMQKQLIDKEQNTQRQPAVSQAGLSQIETARGRLIHHVEIDKGTISNYQILAPTEWNFHPRGLIAQNLSAINTDDENELDQLAHILINAIDPCVGYQLRIH